MCVHVWVSGWMVGWMRGWVGVLIRGGAGEWIAWGGYGQ